LYAQINRKPHRTLFVIGTADSHYDPEKLAEVQHATAGRALVIEDADLSLELTGNIVQSVRIPEGIIAEVQTFFWQC
jgi:hypothetical protein